MPKITEMPPNDGRDPPRGIYQSRVDDKGRLKLPAVFQQFLSRGSDEVRLFATTLDQRIARLYFLEDWLATEQLLQEGREANQVLLDARDVGGDTTMDTQGRVLLPTQLRRSLKLENSSVYLEVYRRHIRVFTEAAFEEERRRSAEQLRDESREL